MRRLVQDPVAYRYEHARRPEMHDAADERPGEATSTSPPASKDSAEPFSTQMYLPMPDGRTTLANFFSPLVNNMEKMFLTGKPTYPVERTLLTTGLTAAGVESLYRKQARYRDAASGIHYQPTRRIDLLENLAHMPKRIAVITTVYQLPFARAARGRPDSGRLSARRASGTGPDMKIVSLYVDQKPEGDLSAERAREFGFKVYPTIAEALRCGGDKLAVDAVMIIGEHGDYPRNEKGQILYPRYEFFKQCVDVFEKDGRAVPVFNDKHLSYSFEKAKWMVDACKAAWISDAGRLVAAGNLATAGYRVAARLRDRRRADGGRGRFGCHGLPRARSACNAWWSGARGGETGVKAVQLIEGRRGVEGGR